MYEGWRAELIKAQALTEAAIDFSDEGDVGDLGRRVKRASRVESLAKRIRIHLDDGHRGEILRDGFHVVIAGPPNVGKSSFLNAMVRREAAIVSEEEGTTRDVIEVRMDLGGLPVVLSDTAGIRETEGKIEREGIRRTLDRARDADLVLWLMDASRIRRPICRLDLAAQSPRVLRVLNKIDLALQTWAQEPSWLRLSLRSGEGLADVTKAIEAEARAADRRDGGTGHHAGAPSPAARGVRRGAG